MAGPVTTRSQSTLYLLGVPTAMVSAIRLASNGEVLGLFCHHHLNLGLTTRQASTRVIDEVIGVWNKARIPTCRKDHAITKLEQLYKDWSTLKKHRTRTTEHHKSSEAEFCAKMENLFDIAHAEAATMIKIQEDLEFLEAQREPGRRGYMGAIDKPLAAKEERKAKGLKLERMRHERQHAADQANKQAAMDSSLALEEDNISCCNEPNNSDSVETVQYLTPSESQTPSRKRQRGTTKVITPKLAAALDRTKLSDRKATFVIAEAATSLGHDIGGFCINRSSIKRQRENKNKLITHDEEQFQFLLQVVADHRRRYSDCRKSILQELNNND